MSDRAACYIERAGGGDLIVRIRYCDPRGSREWLAPGGTKQGPAVRDNILLAAAWIHEQVSGASTRLSVDVVLDLDGGVCGWLTAPSADEKTVRGALVAAKAGVGPGGDEREGAQASWLSQGELGSDVSIQALAEGAAPSKTGAIAARQRLAIMCVPDLAARVLLDELDRLGIEVERVMSLWHALAAWEPGRRGEMFGGAERQAEVVASSEPVTAVLAVEPTGRVAWSWVRDGRLLAGGSMRLKRVVSHVPDAVEEGEATEEATEDSGTIRRIGPKRAEPSQVLEVSRADVGRLVSEWLAWGTQLGVAPARLACLGPWSITPSGLGLDLPDVSGIAAMGAAVGKAWPGTNVSAKVDEDAVAATLARLVRGPEGLASPAQGSPAPTTDLLELSRRPGRTNRVLYRWLTLSLVAGSVVFVAAGIRMGSSTAKLEAAADETIKQRAEAIKQVQDLVKIQLDDPQPVETLQARLNKIRADRAAVKPDEPLLAEINRFMDALAGLPDTQLLSLSMNSMREGLEIGRLAFKFESAKENAAGAVFKDRLATLAPATGRWVNWEVKIPVSTPDREEFALVGRWADAPKVLPKPTAKLPDPKPAEPKATDTSPVDDAGKSEDKPATKPAEAKPAEPKPAEPKPEEKQP